VGSCGTEVDGIKELVAQMIPLQSLGKWSGFEDGGHRDDTLAMAAEAFDYASRLPWCQKVDEGWYDRGVGVLGVFYFTYTTDSGEHEATWIVVGDIPPYQIDAALAHDGPSVLAQFVRDASDWSEAIAAGKSAVGLMPVLARRSLVPIEPTLQLAQGLGGRARFIEREILPRWEVARPASARKGLNEPGPQLLRVTQRMIRIEDVAHSDHFASEHDRRVATKLGQEAQALTRRLHWCGSVEGAWYERGNEVASVFYFRFKTKEGRTRDTWIAVGDMPPYQSWTDTAPDGACVLASCAITMRGWAKAVLSGKSLLGLEMVVQRHNLLPLQPTRASAQWVLTRSRRIEVALLPQWPKELAASGYNWR